MRMTYWRHWFSVWHQIAITKSALYEHFLIGS